MNERIQVWPRPIFRVFLEIPMEIWQPTIHLFPSQLMIPPSGPSFRLFFLNRYIFIFIYKIVFYKRPHQTENENKLKKKNDQKNQTGAEVGLRHRVGLWCCPESRAGFELRKEWEAEALSHPSAWGPARSRWPGQWGWMRHLVSGRCFEACVGGVGRR